MSTVSLPHNCSSQNYYRQVVCSNYNFYLECQIAVQNFVTVLDLLYKNKQLKVCYTCMQGKIGGMHTIIIYISII